MSEQPPTSTTACDNATAVTERDGAFPTRERVDAIWQTADRQLVDDLAQAICRGCVAYEVRLPPGCLTAITKSILFTLDQRRRVNADA